MRKYKPLPAVERLRELLDYDPETGALPWRVRRGRTARPGSPAGTHTRCSLIVKVDWVGYQMHRLIWKMMTGADPIDEIDHKDGNPRNNAFANLREATHAQNSRNRRVQR